MKRNKKIFLLAAVVIVIIIGAAVCCKFIFLTDRDTTEPEKVVLFIDGEPDFECREVVLEDCREECVDYNPEKGSLLFVNGENQIVERDISGEEHVIDIEAMDLTEPVSNVQYGPDDTSICFVYENKIYQYSFKDQEILYETDGRGGYRRRTYIWENDECGYKLMHNERGMSELYRMDKREEAGQKVCEGQIWSIGQVQGNKIYALETYDGPYYSSVAESRSRIVAVDISDGTKETIQELGSWSWTESTALFICDGEDMYYFQEKGKKGCLYRIDLKTGRRKKVYSTRNEVIGIECVRDTPE